jgi:riboflavin kinase/FMN adenylyltransferase
MQLITDLKQLPDACAGGTAMCIGVFDGVHRGHRLLIGAAIRQARRRGLKSLVFTFRDHPLAVLAPPYAPPLLTSPEEKAELIAAEGVDLCAMIDFTPEFAATSADVFLEYLVAGSCQARFIACGTDFRFGSHGVGNIDMLRTDGARLGLEVKVIEALVNGQIEIKSTRVRQCLLEGKLAEANHLLGRPYWLTGKIVHGDHRGRTIGYPTANVEPPPRRLIPENGIYAARAVVGGRTYDAMMSIGIRPTFNSPRRTIEVTCSISPAIFMAGNCGSSSSSACATN